MNKVHVCQCGLDLAIYLYRTNLHEIPESELMLILDLCQHEWNGLVACYPYFYCYCLKTVSVDDLVPKFQQYYIHTWYETFNWDSSSGVTDSDPGDFYTAIKEDTIKEAKVNSTICYFRYDENLEPFLSALSKISIETCFW